ncbi:uncharacterized protein LOC124160735 isoform X2 [Ischnura elegans]|uniref:uncharacterized protein LOC124160735 isoform X2 n=1 Tax=Ischnura elegans TaxID=197161 RepID=UPI001ED8B95E|nr:uncharacterized protein LOC124160735 isoform X2 [Ischnura elegans]
MGEGEEESSDEEEDVEEEENDVDEGKGKKQMSTAPRTAVKSSGGGEVVEKDVGVLEEDSAPSNAIRSVEEETEESVVEEPIRHAEESAEGSVAEEISEEEKGVGARHGGEEVTMKIVEGDRSGVERQGQESKSSEECEEENKYELRVGDGKTASAEVVQRTDEKTLSVEEMKIALEKSEELKMMEKDLVGKIHDETEDINVNDEKKMKSSVSKGSHVECEGVKSSAEEDNVLKEVADENIDGIQDENMENEILKEKSSVSKHSGSEIEEGKVLRVNTFKDKEETEMEAVVPEESIDDGDKEEESKRPNEINLEANAVIVDSEATHTAEVDESEDKGIKRGVGKAVKHGKQSEDIAGPATLGSRAVFAIEFSNNAAEEASSVGSQSNPEAIESRGDGSVDSEALEGQPVGENVVSEGGMVGNSEADDNSEDRSALEEKVEEEIISVESYRTATVVEGKDEPKSEEECVKQDGVVIERTEGELLEEPSELRVEEFVNPQCMREMSENSSKLSDEPDACRDKKEISIVDAIIPSEKREIMEETKGRVIVGKEENVENSIDPIVKANEKSEETDEILKSENMIGTPEISEKIISKSDSEDILEVCEEKEIVEENVNRVNIGESVEKEDIKENVKTDSFEESMKTVIAEEILKGKPVEKIKKRGKFVKKAKTKNISCPSDFSMKAENEARNETSEGPSQISNNGVAESTASKETGERELSGFEIVTCSGEKSIPEKGTDTTVSAGQTALLSEEGSEEEEGEGHNSASVVLLSYRPLFEPSASGPTGESEACEGVHSGDRVGDDDPPNGPGASGGTLSTVGGVASEVPTSGDVEGGEEAVVKPPATHTTASVAIPCTPPTAAATTPVEGKVFSLEKEEEERGEKEGKATLLASKKPPSVPCETRLEAVRVEEDHKGGLSSEVTTAGVKSRRKRRNRKRRRRRGGRQKEEEASAGVEEEDEEDHGEEEPRTEEEAVVLPVEAEDLSPAMGDGRPDSVQQEGEAAAPGKVVVELAPGEGSGGEDSMAAQDSDEGETSSGEFDLASGPRWNSMMTPPSVSSNSDAAGNSEESDSDDENFSRVFVVNPVDDEEDEGVGRGEEDEDDDDEEEVKAEGGVKGADAGAKQVVVKLEGAVLPYGGAGVRLMHIRTLTDEDHVPSNVCKAKDPSVEVIHAPLTEQDEVRASSSTSPLVDSDYSDRERGDADSDEKLDGEQSAVEIFAEKLGDVSAARGDSLELCAENSLGEDDHSIPTLTKLSSILEPDPPIIYALRDDSRDTYRERSESIDKSNEAFDSSAEAEMADVGAGRHPPPLPQVAEEAAGAVHVISPASGGEAGGEAGESGDHAVAKAGGGGGGADPGGGGVVAMETEGAALGAVEAEDDVPASAGETGKKKDVGSGDGEEERAADSSPAGGESGGGDPGESAPIGEDADGVSGDGGLEVGNGSGAAVAPGEEECISGPSVCDVSGGEGGGSVRVADCGGGDSVLVSALPVSIGSKRDPREGEEAGDKEDISVNDKAVIVEAVCESTVADRSAVGAAAPSLLEDADAGDCVIKGDETQVDAPVTSELCEEISVMGDIDGENKEGKVEGEIEEDDTVDVFSESSPKGSESGEVEQKIRDSNMSEEPPPEVRTGGSDVSEGVVGSEDAEDGDNAVEGIARVDDKDKTGPAPGPVSLRSVFESKGEQKPEKEGESMDEEEYRISPQLHAKATKAELVSSPHGSERGEDEIKGLGSGDEEIWGLESDIHSGERGIVVDEVEISPAEGAPTPAPALTPREEQAGGDGSGGGSEMALAIAVGEGKEVEGGVEGEGPEVEFGGEEERIDPVPAVGLADRLPPTSDTTPAPAPSSSSPLPPVSPQTRRRSSLPPPPPPTPSPPGENAPEGGRGSVDAWRAPSEDDGVFHRGSGFRWRTVGGRTAGEGRCVSLEDILHPEARSPTFAASGLGSTSESAITTTTTTGGGGVYTSYVMITQDGGEGLSAGDSEGLSHELEESEDGEGAAEEGGEERLQRVNVSVVEVSVVTSETTTLVSEEEEDRDAVDAEDDDEEEDEVSSDEGGVVLKHANWEEEEDNNKSNRGLAGYFTLTLETGTASPTPPRRPEVMSRKTIQLKDPSGMGNGVVDLPIGGGDMSGGDSSVDSDDGRKGERDAVRVVTGGDTLSAVVCLEEGLADDDSWVEEVDATIDDIRDEDDDDELGSESASSGDEAYFDREEELRGYNRAIDFTLHTILEESGEESEAESHLAASQSKNQAVSQGGNKKQSASNAEADASELEKYYFFDLGGMKGGNQQEGEADDQKFANEESEISDTVSETSCSSIYSEGLESMGMLGAGAHDGFSETADSILGMDPAELASSRLEKYFMTNILGLEPPRGLRAPLGDEDAFSENTDESGSVGSDSEGRPSPEQRRKRLVRARGAGRQHHNSGGSGGGAASDAEAANGSPSGTTSEGAYSQQLTHTHSQAHHHQQQQKLLGQQQNQQQQLNGSQQDLGDLEGSSSGSDSFDETAFEKNDGQFDTVKRKKKKRKDNRHSEGETKEESVALSGEDHEGAKTPQPDLATVAEEEEDGGDDRVGGGERERDDEVGALEAENSIGPGGQAGRKQASRDSGFIGSCDDLLKDQQQQRASDGEQRSSGSDKDTKNSGQKDSGGVEERVTSAASARKGEVETQVPKEGDVKPSLDVIGEAEVAPLPTPRPVPSGSPASITRTSLSRKDSFNNWSSDEETNLMMSKMRAFFKTMVAGKMAAANSSGLRRSLSNSSRQSNGADAHSASSSTNGDVAEPTEKVKPPQLVYFENELTRLMKTVPGIRDEQVREIVEYLSSEDTWSDSYDSSDYTSSDVEVAGMGYHGRGPSGPLRSELQQQISASCQQIIKNFDNCAVEDVEEEESFTRSKTAANPTSDAMNRETAFVYQRLVASFGKVAGGVGEPSSSDASSTPHSSPPLIAKVMHHIGGRLVALMHEVSAAGSGEGPHASTSSSPNFTRNLPGGAGSPKSGNNQAAAAMAARYRRLLRREAAAAAKDDKGSVTSTSVESECPSTDTEERSVDSDADSSSSSPPPLPRLPSLPRSKSHDLGQWQRLLLTGEGNRRASEAHYYYSGIGSSGGASGVSGAMGPSGVHHAGGRDNKESLRSSSSGVSDLAEEREEYERLSWKGSFESALAADSRTKLSMEAKRRSAGSGSGSASDLCSSSDQLDHRGRVRSCGSITSAGSRGSLLQQQQQLGARARLSGSGGDLLAYRSSASRGGTVAEEHEGEGDDEGDGDAAGSTGALARRRRSVPDARGPPGERSTTLPRSNTAVSASTNSLPRLPTGSAPPHGTAAAAIHKSQSLMGHHMQQAHQQQQSHHHHHHLFLQNVKSARYRPPGFRPPPVPPVPPKRAVSVPGLNHQSRGRGERRRQSSGDDAVGSTEAVGKGLGSAAAGSAAPTAGSAPPTPGGGKKVSTGSSHGSWPTSPPLSPSAGANHNTADDETTNERIPSVQHQSSTLSSLGGSQMRPVGLNVSFRAPRNHSWCGCHPRPVHYMVVMWNLCLL